MISRYRADLSSHIENLFFMLFVYRSKLLSMALFADLSEGKSAIERGGVMPERFPWSIEAAV
jgi:hypothetical protein